MHAVVAPPTADQLDSRIEVRLRQAFGVEIDFAVNGALGKLEGLSRLRRRQERLFVSPFDGAIAQLHGVWGEFFASRDQMPKNGNGGPGSGVIA
jgi:hypothetical protein